jgi:hypothetical protein
MIEYDQSMFSVQRKSGSTWVPILAASLTMTEDWSIVDHHVGSEFSLPPSSISTFCYGSETLTLTWSRWDTQTLDIPFVLDTVRAMYDGELLMLGTVEQVSKLTDADPEAWRYGATRRIDLTATIGGLYADLLSKTVYWGTTAGPDGVTRVYSPALPQESWQQRIKRWVTVQ